jgi:hypothetical protein
MVDEIETHSPTSTITTTITAVTRITGQKGKV